MRSNVVVMVVAITLFCLTSQAAEPRPAWDQAKAVQAVKRVIAIENKGDLPWDKIPWETDIQKAVARSQKENKPLFVYFFLMKNAGPAAAPC